MGEQIGDINAIFEEIGPRGWFQIKTVALLWSSTAALGLSALLFAFVAYVPNYRCPVSECGEVPGFKYYGNQVEQTLPQFLQDAFPADEVSSRIGKCQQYKFYEDDDSDEPMTCLTFVDRLRHNFSEANLTYCDQDELIIDQTYALTTLTVDFGFLCDLQYLRDFYNTTYMVGMLFGAFIFGIISDRYGRLKALVSASVLLFSAGMISAFATIPEVYGFLRLLTGMGGIGTYMCGYLLGLENTTPKYSVQVGMAISLGFVWGALLLSLIVYCIRDWTTLHLVTYAPIALMFLLWWLVPESPRWLIAKGRILEAKKILNHIADFNGRPHPNHLYQTDLGKKEKVEDAVDQLSVWDLIKSRTLFFRTLALSLQWASVTMAYYGITFALTSFAGDPYLNFVLGILSELPSTAYTYFTLDFFGRRFMTAKLQLVSGLACILAGLCMEYESFRSFQIVFAMLGKFSATCMYAVIYLYTAELYPTAIRNQAMGVCSTVARLGGMLALMIGALRSVWPPFPMMIMGVIASFAGLIALTLPETTGIPLPESKKDAVTIRRRGGHFRLFGCHNGHA